MISDFVIVGGGPAGLAAGIYARLAGLSAVVVERGTSPIDKACGEGIMPAGVRALAEMGVRLPPERRAEFHGVRFIDEGLVATARFRDAVGWGVRRTRLSEALVRRAEELAVHLRFGATVTRLEREADGTMCAVTDAGVVRGRLLVGADGLHSMVRRWLASAGGAAARATEWHAYARPRRFGMRQHFAVRPWSPFVEVHFARGFEAYVTPVGDEEVGIALLWSGEKAAFTELLARLPRLEERVRAAGSLSTSALRGAGPMAQHPRVRVGAGVALVGDAAGYLDALTGEGLSLSFRTARALVDCIARGEPEPLRAYERRYRQITRGYYSITKAMLRLSRHPRLRRRVLWLLAQSPGLFAATLGLMESETLSWGQQWLGHRARPSVSL